MTASGPGANTVQPDEHKNLQSCSKDELIQQIQRLEEELASYRTKTENKTPNPDSLSPKRKKRKQRVFDFTKYNTRHIALKFLYLGWDYQGFASQENTDKTIEACMFEALLKTRLIEDRQSANYSRCGRTDKGVSAFGQVISLDVRTNLLEGVGVKVRPDGTAADRPGDKTTELNYVKMLNSVLPEEIRILAWTPVDHEFNARYSAASRTYKYFFPEADLDVEAMKTGLQKLVGLHDYRNFCKMDVANGVINFVRRIMSADIKDLDTRGDGYRMYELTIQGMSFLYHQIRCIVAVLFLIGQHKEKPEIIDELLDVDKHPCKPQYSMASELPLVLYDTHFEGITWIYDHDDQEVNIKHLQKRWTSETIKSLMVGRMLDGLNSAPFAQRTNVENQTITTWEKVHPPILLQNAALTMGSKSRQYKPLLSRPVCDSLEGRIEHFSKKRKLNDPQES
ncbi:tRNA pseudouridine(38/39) synthase-like isoform X2 [Ptychodera flava]|uniref:tRNA pseudouridine(38/39) synthase-like isoform X2 n=1 Tax=Ptychodera flava TaxID=63121 RepID=UPI003969E7C8